MAQVLIDLLCIVLQPGIFALAIFGLQFVAMLMHRLSTAIHHIARVPPTCGDPYYTNWSWMDKRVPVHPAPQ